MPVLTTTVHLRDQSGQVVSFGPGQALPAWAEAAITNPDVWAPDPEPDPEPEPAAALTKPSVKARRR